jgi:hypothetical protein
MARLDAIERYRVANPVSCPFCFFGIVVAGLCTNCDGRDAVDAAVARNKSTEPQIGEE